MRLLNLYIVYDRQAKTIIGPIVHDHSAVPIVRQITEAVNKPGTMIANTPEDFDIRHIGMIDEESGNLYDIYGEQLKNDIQTVAQAIALRARDQ